MALGKTNRQFEGKSYSLQYKLKDGEKFVDVGYFLVSEPTGEVDAKGKKVYKEVGRETDVAGDLVRIETDTRETDNGAIRSFTLALSDPEKKETYFTKFSLGSGVARSLANSILNLKNFTNVQLGSYGQFSKEKNKTYPAMSLRQGDDSATVKWKYDPKAENSPFPKAREFVGKGGKKEMDYTEQEVFLQEKLKEFGEVVAEAAKKRRGGSTEQSSVASTPKTQNQTSQENLDEDVPF